MNNKERIQKRIERDKERRRKKRLEKNKEYDNFDNVIKFQNYIPALRKCNKGVSKKGSVQKYNHRAIENIYETKTTIKSGRLPKLKNSKRIYLYERGKKREIVPIIITDRMTQRVICDNSFIPIITPTLIYDNGASMKNKGIDFARKRIDRHLKEAVAEWGTDFYILTYDFKHFFESIPHRTCQGILDNCYSDKRLARLLMAIVKSYYTNGETTGICLGSQISQGLAVVVPNAVDHLAKDIMGFRHYMRYMDDGVVFAKTKAELWAFLDAMEVLCKRLGLILNKTKTAVTRATRGFIWLKTKYNITKTGYVLKRLTRKGTVRMRRKLKKFKKKVDSGEMTLKQVYDSAQSWAAHTKGRRAKKTIKCMNKLLKRLFGFTLPKGKGGTKKYDLLQNRERYRRYYWDCNVGQSVPLRQQGQCTAC